MNGTLQIEYQDGALCTQNITTPHVKTIITFICNLKAMVQQLIRKYIHTHTYLYIYIQKKIHI